MAKGSGSKKKSSNLSESENRDNVPTKFGRGKILDCVLTQVKEKMKNTEEVIGFTPIHGTGIVLGRISLGKGSEVLQKNIKDGNGRWEVNLTGGIVFMVREKKCKTWVIKNTPKKENVNLLQWGIEIGKENGLAVGSIRVFGKSGIKLGVYNTEKLDFVKIDKKRFPVEEEIAHGECFKCWSTEHTSHSCTNKPKCGRCAGEHWHTECRAKKGDFQCILCPEKHTSFQCPKRAYRVALVKKRQAAGKMEERKGRGGPSKGHGGPRPKQVAKVEKVVKAPVHDNQTDVSNMMKAMMDRINKLNEIY